MTSEQRHEARYRRRVAKRKAKKAMRLKDVDNYNAVFTYEHLYKSYKQCRKGVGWKASVQKYITQAPLNVYNTYTQLMDGRFRTPGFYEFDLYERGKHRHIRSIVIGERVVQRCLCDYALVPALERTFVYDNGASLKNKGYTFAVNRITNHLRQYYRKYGQEGYVLVFDFSKFFDNVSHEVVKRMVRKEITDEQLLFIIDHLIDAFGNKGLGLGSQISQVLALSSANKLDHLCKETLNIRYYGRYMDDGYLIHPSKEYLKECLEHMNAVCKELGIVLNKKKTQIIKLSHGFTWLKIRFFLTPSGMVVRKIYKRSVVKQRQKLKKLRIKLDEGILSFEDIQSSWQSWKAYASNFDAYFTIKNMEKLYNKLFYKEINNGIYKIAI